MRSNPVIILQHPPLNKEQLRDAFGVSETTPIWQAIKQTIIEDRADWEAREAAAAQANNALDMAVCVGASNALASLLIDLESQRVASNR